MMCQTGKYKLAWRQEEQVKVLELPYTGEEFSMFILLPENICDESTGLEQVTLLSLLLGAETTCPSRT